MKKLFLVISIIFSIFSFSTFAQESEDASQVVLPLEMFIGDRAEIRYIFRSAIDFFSGEIGVERKELKNPFEGLEENFSVLSAELSRNDMEYTVKFVIVPWKVGTIVFPSFNLNTALDIKKTDIENPYEPQFIVALHPVQVNSIVEKTDNRQIMPPVPPIIIPGTTYVIFLIVLFAVVFLILFFRVLLKFNATKQKWLLYLKRRAFRKNAEAAIKRIRKLLKNLKLTDIEFCSSLQQITRKYLDFRFDYMFSAISSNGIIKAFENICAGSIPLEIAGSVENLVAMFVRTDYIRYAHDSIDSQLYPPIEHQAALGKNERKNLAEMIIEAIKTFENDEKNLGQEEEIVS